MPIYEYRCGKCGKRSSALLPRFSAPDPPCPHCGSKDVERLVSTFATVRSEGDDLADFGDDADTGGFDDGGFGDGGDDYGGGSDDWD
ncbi:MAG: zinc ribbon domain-containing protein [Chloroflexi bacterium]|nr:MAG: zinc ribbon domain-containing protein [Chloroflexota bacterium]TME17503.1 MAG: zinc ribbon domain-containing protein [Chloroflexota bacterium]TME19564.1 MAG: zinc ribbon domain-containing protein [Chloroflexota bacterium]